MSDSPPRRMKIDEVPEYVQRAIGFRPTRQTVYNWIKKGRGGVKLAFADIKAPIESRFQTVRITTTEWVDEFLRKASFQL